MDTPSGHLEPSGVAGIRTAAFLSVVAAVVVLFGVWPLTGGDLITWLTIGRWSWEHGGPPLVDPFSYTTEGQEFLAHSWLAGMVFYLVEHYTGTVGFMVLRLTLVSVALTFAVKTARLLKASWPCIVLLAPVVLAVMWARLEFRPQLFTTALLSFELWLIVSVHSGHRAWLWVLPPLYALWINLHAGWPQGLAMLVVVLGASVAMAVRQRWVSSQVYSEYTSQHPRWWQLALVIAMCLLALLVNPFGVRLIAFPLEMQADWIRAVGPEWQSPKQRGPTIQAALPSVV